MLKRLVLTALILAGLVVPAAAQGYNGPNHYTPAMTGGGTQLRGVAPGSAGGLYTSQGASADPHFVVPSANIQSILGAADYGAVRALLDLEPGTDFYSISAADAAFQPKDSDLAIWAGITPGSGVGTALAAGFAANVQSILGAANYSAIRTLLALVIGTNVQAWDTDLDAWALITPGSGVSAAVTTGFTSAVQSVLDDASIAAMDTTLGLGTGSSPQFTCVEVGAASDTSLCRNAAGDVQVEGNRIFRVGGTDVPVADGGTGSSSASGARTNLGLVIGTDVLPVANPAPTGLLDLSAASTGQIKFPASQNASANANTLDDYEEGTFTPAITGTSTAGTGTYTLQVGTYTKIGNRVTAEASIVWTAHTGTGNLTITGLPFTAANGAVVHIYISQLTFAATYPEALLGSGGTTISLTTVATGGVAAALAMDTAATIVFSVSYPT